MSVPEILTMIVVIAGLIILCIIVALTETSTRKIIQGCIKLEEIREYRNKHKESKETNE